jgi:phosphonate transport system substrate-binding protein
VAPPRPEGAPTATGGLLGLSPPRAFCRGNTNGYFGRIVEAAWHEKALRLIAGGAVDAAAIDYQVLPVALRTQPELAARMRIIDTLGPPTIQLVIAARRLPQRLQTDLRAFLLDLANDPVGRPHLDRALVQGFEPVNERSYNDIRTMLAATEVADFLTLR